MSVRMTSAIVSSTSWSCSRFRPSFSLRSSLALARSRCPRTSSPSSPSRLALAILSSTIPSMKSRTFFRARACSLFFSVGVLKKYPRTGLFMRRSYSSFRTWMASATGWRRMFRQLLNAKLNAAAPKISSVSICIVGRSSIVIVCCCCFPAFASESHSFSDMSTATPFALSIVSLLSALIIACRWNFHSFPSSSKMFFLPVIISSCRFTKPGIFMRAGVLCRITRASSLLRTVTVGVPKYHMAVTPEALAWSAHICFRDASRPTVRSSTWPTSHWGSGGDGRPGNGDRECLRRRYNSRAKRAAAARERAPRRRESIVGGGGVGGGAPALYAYAYAG
mmetsp:Transcript_14629/g.31807  ORF Transcript_14629/g.31807 Transcript_14629/m.31807 type:complete len:336 (+) Transcript_14629:605-1612(+)